MTDHISEPLFFFHSAMHCNPSEMSTSIKVRGGAHLFTFGQYFQVYILKNDLKFSLNTDDANRYPVHESMKDL